MIEKVNVQERREQLKDFHGISRKAAAETARVRIGSREFDSTDHGRLKKQRSSVVAFSKTIFKKQPQSGM